jgi:Ran GTPase-activating protein (RanGAP) involved in mRNA processing and transport
VIAINLGGNSITDEGGERLFASLAANKSVVSFDVGSTSVVGHNSFGSRSCEAIARMLRANLVLSRLNISMSDITADTVPIIADGLACNRTLQFLDISNNNVQSKGAIVLLGACARSRITELHIAYNHVTDDVSQTFLSYQKSNDSIRTLDLAGNYLTKGFTSAVAISLDGGARLETLNLCDNALRGDGLAALGKALARNQTLRHLYVGNCQIDSRGFIEFCESLAHNSALCLLHVPRNPLLDEGATRFAELVEQNDVIRDVDFELCDITDSGGSRLFEAFAKSRSIQRISVRNNLIRNGTLIQRTVISSPQIFYLNLDYNTLDYRIIFEIQRLVAENRRCWRRGHVRRVRQEVSKLSQVDGRLIETRTGIITGRHDIEYLGEKLKELRVTVQETRVRRDEKIEFLQQKLAEMTADALAFSDTCREEGSSVRSNIEFKETEVTGLSSRVENTTAQLTRDSKVLAVLEDKIHELTKQRHFGGIDMGRQLEMVKAKYIDARQVVEKKWKDAHGARKRMKRTNVGMEATVAGPMQLPKLLPDEGLEKSATLGIPLSISKKWSQTLPMAKVIKPITRKPPNLPSPTLSKQDLP